MLSYGADPFQAATCSTVTPLLAPTISPIGVVPTPRIVARRPVPKDSGFETLSTLLRPIRTSSGTGSTGYLSYKWSGMPTTHSV